VGRASTAGPGGFFGTLNYSSVNEDWRTEAAALQAGPGDSVLCVTGSGCRALDLLALGPARVVAIDRNPAQTALLRLKVAALRQLPFDEYAAFLGLRKAAPRWRLEVLSSLAPHLGDAAAFWQRHQGAVASGVLYAGRWERHYRRLARLARLSRPRAIEELFDCADLERQREFVARRWDSWWWRRTYDVLCSPALSRAGFGDPAFYEHVGVRVGAFLYGRMLASLQRTLARENFMVSLALKGALTPLDLPPCLTPEGAEVIRARLDRLELVTDDLFEHLHSPQGRRYSRFSLSDVPSFLGQAPFEHLLDGVSRAALPGARFCIRQFLTRQQFPDRLSHTLVREPALERRLALEDHAFAYDFLVGSVAQ
jgi:S-adenosylmethionine-diacylglycerol 3-amino-3-carboxypropyl transferase